MTGTVEESRSERRRALRRGRRHGRPYTKRDMRLVRCDRRRRNRVARAARKRNR